MDAERRRGAARRLGAAVWLAAALLGAPAWGGTMGPLVTDQPVAWGSGEVRVGDAEARVRRTAGRYPDNVQTLSPDDNHAIGERWMFIGRNGDARVLWVELIRGRVTRVWTEPIDETLQPGASPH